MTTTTDALRNAFARATIAAETARRAAYVAVRSGSGAVRALKREAAAQARLDAAERAYRGATKAA